MSVNVYDDGVSYLVLDSEVKFYADETAYGWNVVAEYYGNYHYLGDDRVSLQLAIEFWEERHKRFLSDEELKQIMEDNHIIV